MRTASEREETALARERDDWPVRCEFGSQLGSFPHPSQKKIRGKELTSCPKRLCSIPGGCGKPPPSAMSRSSNEVAELHPVLVVPSGELQRRSSRLWRGLPCVPGCVEGEGEPGNMKNWVDPVRWRARMGSGVADVARDWFERVEDRVLCESWIELGVMKMSLNERSWAGDDDVLALRAPDAMSGDD